MPKSRAFKNADDALVTTEVELSTALKQAQMFKDIAAAVGAILKLRVKPKLVFHWKSLFAEELDGDDWKGLKAILGTNILDVVSNFATRCGDSPVSFHTHEDFVSITIESWKHPAEIPFHSATIGCSLSLPSVKWQRA